MNCSVRLMTCAVALSCASVLHAQNASAPKTVAVLVVMTAKPGVERAQVSGIVGAVGHRDVPVDPTGDDCVAHDGDGDSSYPVVTLKRLQYYGPQREQALCEHKAKKQLDQPNQLI